MIIGGSAIRRMVDFELATVLWSSVFLLTWEISGADPFLLSGTLFPTPTLLCSILSHSLHSLCLLFPALLCCWADEAVGSLYPEPLAPSPLWPLPLHPRCLCPLWCALHVKHLKLSAQFSTRGGEQPVFGSHQCSFLAHQSPCSPYRETSELQ